jgi:hypothetical protein
MKFTLSKLVLPGLFLSAALLTVVPSLIRAQYPGPYGAPPGMQAPTTPNAQRNALSAVRSQVGWLQNATRSAPGYGSQGAAMLWQQFQTLRSVYSGFTMTLNPQQAAEGANEFAELAGGLNIIQEAFTNYQDDLASGRLVSVALNDLCQVLNQAAAVWLQELNQDCASLNVGW